MSVRAKFRYVSYTAGHMTRPKPDTAGNRPEDVETVEIRTLIFNPVYAPPLNTVLVREHPELRDHPNRVFWNATPVGEIRLGMVNPEAWSQFEMGKEYFIDFTEAADG